MDPQHALDRAVIGLFQTKQSGFLATIYCALRMSWSTDLPTAGTDGRKLLINQEWFLSLSEPMRITLLAHEIWHVAFMHMTRRGTRCPDIWNMACDYAINIMLLNAGYVFDNYPAGHPMEGQRMGLIDAQYDNMSAEEIYDKLIAEGKPMELPFGQDIQYGDGDGEELTDAEKADIVATVVRAVTIHKMSGNDAGDLPGEIVTLIEELLNPVLPWDTMLRKYLADKSTFGSTWTKPNRRYSDIYMPSRGGQEGLVHLLWAIDCSGSVTDSQLQAFNTELKGAKEMHHPERMTVISFDTKIQDEWEFTADHDITGLQFHGRGGTNMREVFERAEKMKPSALIMFSDMECTIPPQPAFDVVWIILDRPHTRMPYGYEIHMDSSRYRDAPQK